VSEPTPPPGPATGVPTCYRHPGRETWIRCQRCDRPICPDCMRDAAVGFQCPHCVAEGARSTRQGRSAYGGRRSSNPAATSLVLIALNAAVWLLVRATGTGLSSPLQSILLRPNGVCVQGGLLTGETEQSCQFGTWLPGVADGAFWQLLTSAFVHVEVWHIGFNMLALYVLGPQLEAVVGRTRFLAVYLLSALAGSVLVMWASPEYGATAGASGAIFGLLGALLVVGLRRRANVSGLMTWIGINVVITVVGSSFISWQGHLGGLVGGVLVAAVIVYAPRARRGAWQLAGLGGVAVLLLALTLARTAVLL
jgi:membrane associated rhomboid family serine protease